MDECFDLLYEGRAALDTSTIDCSKDVFKAFAMPHTPFDLSLEDRQHLEHYKDQMPPNYGKYLGRLGQIAELAAVRDTLAAAETGTAANEILKSLGLLTHMDDNCQGMSEAGKKRYIMNAVDSVLESFLQAVGSMKDRKTGVVEFLRKLDGVCVEAKSDNIQDWVLRSMGVAGPARSEEKHDLAYSATAEFNALADEVKAPFREEARKACEAQVRADCEKEGVTDPETVESRIQSKVEMILLEKDDEIAPLIRQKLETEGRLALYENLAGAKRPLTQITKDAGTGKWTVRTFTDEKGAPIMKPVSAYDIDRNFSRLVDMYMEDAISMGMVENKTVKTDQMKVGDRMDRHAKGVTDLASKINRGSDKGLKDFAKVVNGMLRFKIDIPEEEFVAAVKSAIVEVASLKKDDSEEETKRLFGNYMNNFADGSYADHVNDIGRLANLVARRVEDVKAGKDARGKNLDVKAAHCAQMLKLSYPDMVVDTKKAQAAIETTLRKMIELADQNLRNAGTHLKKLMYNGRFFTDRLDYDIAHRAAGKAEIDLLANLRLVLQCVKHYGGIDPATFFHKPGEEVQA